MRVAVIQHFRIPYRRAGSEIAMHSLCLTLRDRGHEVIQVTSDVPEASRVETLDGMACHQAGANPLVVNATVRTFKPDLVLTHHQRSMWAIPLARAIGVPVAIYIHNDMSHSLRELAMGPDFVIFNTQWLSDKLSHRARKSLVVHPPVFPQNCDGTGDKVTLINLNSHKGAPILYRLAQSMPDTQFLGVVGAHGQQVIRRDLPNVEIQPHTSDMCGDVWSKTGVLLMPSVYESYGMTGLEAASCGIPVLANPTPGLKESLAEAGWFIPRRSIQEYGNAIRALKDPATYETWSARALKRFSEIDPGRELQAFAQAMERLAGKG